MFSSSENAETGNNLYSEVFHHHDYPSNLFTSPLYFNMTEDNNGIGGIPPPYLLPPGAVEPFYQEINSKDEDVLKPFSFTPHFPPPGDHSFVSSAFSNLPVPLSSFFFQSLMDEQTDFPEGSVEGEIMSQEYHFAPEPSPFLARGFFNGEGEENFGSSSSTSPALDPFAFGSQAATAHNRRMIFPYSYKKGNNKGSTGGNVSSTSYPSTSSSSSTGHDEPQLLYRFFEFYCKNCEQNWLSPLFRAKSGCFCRTCRRFILPRGIRHSFTPYLGKETCYGKYACHLCKRGWSSYKSLSNCPDQCFQCGTLIYPYYQISHSVLYEKINRNEHEPILHETMGPSASNNSPAKSAFLKSLFNHDHHHEYPSPSANNAPVGREASTGGYTNLGGIGLSPNDNSRRQNIFSRLPRRITSISVFPHQVTNNSSNGNNRIPPMNVGENLHGIGGMIAAIGLAGVGNFHSNGAKGCNKKRLHCPNNFPSVRQAKLNQLRKGKGSQLKNCFSEPVIPNLNSF